MNATAKKVTKVAAKRTVSKVDQKALAAALKHAPIIAKAVKAPKENRSAKPVADAEVSKVVAAKKVKDPAVKSKADIARELFSTMGDKTRKEVLVAFQEKAGLTPAGSATYYANFKKAAAK